MKSWAKVFLSCLLLCSPASFSQSWNSFQSFRPFRSNYVVRTSQPAPYPEDTSGAAVAFKFNEYWDNFTGITTGTGNSFNTAGTDHTLDFGTSNVAIRIVAKWTTPGTNQVMITTNASEGNGWFWMFWTGGNALRVTFKADDGTTVFHDWTDAYTVATDGLVHQYDVSLDRAANLTLKIDNVVIGTEDATGLAGKTISSNGKTGIGGEEDSLEFKGTIYEIAIATGVTSFSSGGPGSGVNPYNYLSDSETGMLAHWKMDQSASPIVDSKSSISLAEHGSPTYSVAGAGNIANIYDAIGGIKLSVTGVPTYNVSVSGTYALTTPGITVSNGNFLASTDSDIITATTIGTSDFGFALVFSAASYVNGSIIFSIGDYAGTGKGITFYFATGDEIEWFGKTEDNVNVVDSVSIGAGAFDGNPHLLVVLFDRDANTKVYLDGVLKGTSTDILNSTGKTIASYGLGFGDEPNGASTGATVTLDFFKMFLNANYP